MTSIAVLGAGHGGLAAAADLTRRGYDVRMYNRGSGQIEAIRALGGVRSSGAIGHGLAMIGLATTDLAEAVEGAHAVVVVLPSVAHADVGAGLAAVLPDGVPVILNPGHMCGSLHLRRMFSAAGRPPPRIAELATLTYICRSSKPASVDVFLRTRAVPMATTPPERDLSVLASELFPGLRRVNSPIEVWLNDVNLVLHPPGMILGAAWIEHSSGAYRFYAEGVTASVERVMAALDDERQGVGKAYGVVLASLAETMATFGSADPEAALRGDLGEAVRRGSANASIRAPSNIVHRYLLEDVPFGLVPLLALADVAGIATPTADALTTLAEVVTRRPFREEGLNANALGIGGLDVAGVQRLLGRAA